MLDHPWISEGQVVAVDPRRRRLTVQLASAQQIEVRMGYHGPADAVRVSHRPMPGRGTWGLIVFPDGKDNRNGVWICASYPAFVDALTTDDDQFMDYESHWSGAYEVMDQQGRWTKSFPDGTFIQVSDSTTKPTMYRHTVDGQQNQQLTAFSDSERVPNPPSPRHLFVSHPSGTTAHIDPAGNTTVDGAPNSTCTLDFNGATVVIDSTGNITATAATGQQFQANANNGHITIDKNGAIWGDCAPGQHMRFSAGGAASPYTLVRTDLLMALYNAHTHKDSHGDTTGGPLVPMTAAAVQSTMTDVSE